MYYQSTVQSRQMWTYHIRYGTHTGQCRGKWNATPNCATFGQNGQYSNQENSSRRRVGIQASCVFVLAFPQDGMSREKWGWDVPLSRDKEIFLSRCPFLPRKRQEQKSFSCLRPSFPILERPILFQNILFCLRTFISALSSFVPRDVKGQAVKIWYHPARHPGPQFEVLNLSQLYLSTGIVVCSFGCLKRGPLILFRVQNSNHDIFKTTPLLLQLL